MTGRGTLSAVGNRLLTVVLLVGSLCGPWARPAGAALADCKAPGATSYGCVWSGQDYAGDMRVYEGDDRHRAGQCVDGSPRSAANNTPAAAKGRHVFLFYHHPGCEKGGKSFGVLPPEGSDPALPDVQSYVWKAGG